MKRLLVIGGALLALSTMDLFAGNNKSMGNGDAQLVSGNNTLNSDTIPKKDTTKRRDSLVLNLK